MINTQYINLNMIPSGVMPVLYCSQYDVGRPLGVVVYNGAESVDLSGYTCTIEATRTDKTPVTAGVTTSGNIGVFETTATMTNQADTYKGKLVLTDGNGKRVASLAFVLVVTVRTMDEDAEEIEEDASLYQQYTGTVQTIIASIRADLAAEITARQNAISTEASTRAAAVSAEAAARQSADNTLQSNINAEASTRATQDASLQSQIDQLIAPSGEAPSAAEVENARIGSDGTVYPTLGDAIRTQNSLLKSQLNLDYSYSSGATFVLKHITASGTIGDNGNKNAVFAVPLLALKGSTVYVDSGYKFELGLYNKTTGAFIERVNWMTSQYVFADDYLVRIEISDTAESVLPDTSISSHLHYALISQVYSPVKRTVIDFTVLSNINLNYAIGEVVSVTPEYVSTYRHAVVKCKKDDIFILNAKGGVNPRVWGFLDTDNKLISVAASNTASVAQTNLMLIAPEGAAYLVINDQKTGGECVRYSYIETNKYWIDYIKPQLEIYALKDQVDEAIMQASNVFKGLGITAFVGKTVDITSPNKYNAWSVIGVVEGKLICVYSKGLSHSDGVNPAIYAKTSENGVVWSLEHEVTDTEGIRDTITGKGNKASGDFIFWDRIGQPGSGSETFKLFGTADGNVFAVVSSPSFSTRPAHIGDIINVPTVGLMAFFNTMGSGTRTWGYVKSTNDGGAWTQVSVESAIADTACPTEITAAYLGDGKILAIGRKDVIGETTNAMFQMQSSDYGATWTKAYTNITDIAGSTPSLVYDSTDQKLSVYYYVRGGGTLRVREAQVSDVWDNPTNWGSASILTNASTSYEDAGNVNATMFNDIQIATFYSGDSTDTGIYATIND